MGGSDIYIESKERIAWGGSERGGQLGFYEGEEMCGGSERDIGHVYREIGWE